MIFIELIIYIYRLIDVKLDNTPFSTPFGIPGALLLTQIIFNPSKDKKLSAE